LYTFEIGKNCFMATLRGTQIRWHNGNAGEKKDSLEGDIYMDELRGECQSESEQYESERGEKKMAD
jgi:hypothetical protein